MADNRIATEAGWNRNILAAELSELIEILPAEGLEVSLTGFDPIEIELLFADLADNAAVGDDPLPLPENPITRRGDRWLLGPGAILCADSRDATAFSTLLSGERVTACFCDPPYNLRARTIGGRGQIKHDDFAFGAGEMSQAEFREFLRCTLRNGIAVSRPGAVHYVCMGWRHLADLIEVGKDLYGAMLSLIIWNKTSAGQGPFYRSQHEEICVFRVGDEAHQNNVQMGAFGRNRTNVWSYAGVNTFGTGRLETLASYPTVKPVALVVDAILDCSSRGDLVLDQFAGSGTTLLAAEKVGRVGFGIEFEPAYVDVAVKRWEKFTGSTRCWRVMAEPSATSPRSGWLHLNKRLQRSAQMTKRKNSNPDYPVGYRRPPKETRFAPGQSGNPKGRPKGTRTLGAVVRDIMERKVPIAEGGKMRRLPILEVMLLRSANDGMRGDKDAVKLLISLIQRYAESPDANIHFDDLLVEDREILSRCMEGDTGCAPSKKKRPDDEDPNKKS